MRTYVLSNLYNIILHMPELIIKITEIRLERSLYMQFVNKLAFSTLISDLWKFFVCAYYAYDLPNRLNKPQLILYEFQLCIVCQKV